MDPKKRIMVIGSANTDMVIKMAHLPLPGETVLGGSFSMHAGGKGANQAVAAARLGGNTSLVARVGKDVFGEQTIAGLQKEGIDTRYVFLDPENPSGTALIFVDEKGENCIAVAAGANGNLLPADIQSVSLLQEAEIILMQLEVPMATIECAAAHAKQNHQKLIVNPAPAMLLSDTLLKDLYLITPNEGEAECLTGIEVKDMIAAKKAAAVFLGKGVQNVIITLGSRGAFFSNAQESFSVPAPSVTAVDTTAAGDTFTGAIAVALIENRSWKAALEFAVKAASVAVTRMGAQSSVPYRSEIDASSNQSQNNR